MTTNEKFSQPATHAAPAARPQGGAMFTTTTTQVPCPAEHAPCAGNCGGEMVAATWKGSTVELSPCSFVKAQGWVGDVAAVIWSDQMPTEPVGYIHRDGLVVIR